MAGKKSSGNTDKRTRNWMVIVYPDSAPSNWRDVLDDMHIAWTCSPLHDKDVTATGEPKKAHWHIVIAFDAVKTYEQVSEIATALNAPIPQRVESIRGAVRYLIHMDNPDKAQYDRNDIECHGGMEIADYLRTSEQARGNVVRDMCAWVMANDVHEMWTLMQYAMDNEPDWWEALITNSGYIMDLFVRSWRNGGGRRERSRQTDGGGDPDGHNR